MAILHFVAALGGPAVRGSSLELQVDEPEPDLRHFVHENLDRGGRLLHLQHAEPR